MDNRLPFQLGAIFEKAQYRTRRTDSRGLTSTQGRLDTHNLPSFTGGPTTGVQYHEANFVRSVGHVAFIESQGCVGL
jgi:hypothetical protein